MEEEQRYQPKMQKVFLALFSVVALLGLVPSFASAETNGNRLARGLPPLPPSRRDTAKYGTPSHVHHHHHGEDHREGHREGHGQAPSRRDTAKYGTPSHVHHHHHGEDHGEGHGEGHGQAPSGRRTAKRGIPSHVHHHHGQHHGQDHGQSLAPSGRRTAKRGTPSQVYHHHGQNSEYVCVRCLLRALCLAVIYCALTLSRPNDNSVTPRAATFKSATLMALRSAISWTSLAAGACFCPPLVLKL